MGLFGKRAADFRSVHVPEDAATIDDVVSTLRRVADSAMSSESRIGYFAALYLRMTLGVREKTKGRSYFADPARMEQLDVNFANYYFRALRNYLVSGGRVAAAWRIGFDFCASSKLTILQHLYLGLSAHQLLDLGQAAAETSPGLKIQGLRRDFEKVNEIVAELMEDTDHAVGRVSPLIGLWDKVAAHPWALGNMFMIRAAREMAWGAAVDLAGAESPRDSLEIVDRLDRDTVAISRRIAQPFFPIGAVARVIRASERMKVSDGIRALIP
ncbi:MAG: hypothetical protein HY791_15100 [Deltaproteobacteria bacterium]|nr:hypothetical protein [Deltaproteobacteria bacterium]